MLVFVIFIGIPLALLLVLPAIYRRGGGRGWPRHPVASDASSAIYEEQLRQSRQAGIEPPG